MWHAWLLIYFTTLFQLGRGDKSVLGFDGKAQRKYTTWKIER
jgi:hypothetical protein